jgi:hypothetical protein
MDVTKTHKKKRSLKNLINTDKLAENIENFNLEIDDFKKILNKYSISGFSDDTTEVSELIKTIKSKSCKKTHTKNIEPIDKSIIDNFLESKSNEIDAASKTHKKVKFSDLNVDLSHTNKNNNTHNNNNIQQIIKPKALYNPDPRVDLREIVAESMYGSYYPKQPSNPIPAYQSQYKPIPSITSTPSTHSLPSQQSFVNSQPLKSVKIIQLDGGSSKHKTKTKDEIYQEQLQSQIHLIEEKITEYDTYSSYLAENHPFLLELRIEIINQKKKLKELIPNEKNTNINTTTNNNINTNTNNTNLVFKYDQKLAEKEHMEMMKNHYMHKSHKINKHHKPIKNIISKPLPTPVNNTPHKKVIVIESNNKTCPITITPRKEHSQNIKQSISVTKKDFDQLSIPRKESTCNINTPIETVKVLPKNIEIIQNKNEHIEEIKKPIEEIKKPIENKEHSIEQIKNIIPRKHKTIINHNKFKNIKYHRDKSDFYIEDKETSPNKWNSMICNDLTNIKTHVKPVKLTQKKVKDFLIKESITNENNKMPTELMNFLYSSITENEYQINFIDILTK